MHRPAYQPTPVLKPRIDYQKTFQRLYRCYQQPETIRPTAAPAHWEERLFPVRKTIKVLGLISNLRRTMDHVMQIFVAQWRRADRPINLAIRTTRTSLAKRCGNKDPKTAYRHILSLIEHGFLRAKVQVKSGLQLLLNPTLVVFDQSSAPAAAAAPAGPQLAPAALALAARALLGGLTEKYTRETPRPPKKPYSGIKSPFIG